MLFSISLLLCSCSKDDDSQTVNGNAKVAAYLKSFYKKEYHIGKSVETSGIKSSNSILARTGEAESMEFEDIKLTEVFVGNEEEARGYVVTDKVTDEFLYFADVDRANYKLTTFDAEQNETLIKNNIDQLQEWASSNKLDLIVLLEQYRDEVSSGVVGKRRFWGWGHADDGQCGPNSNGDGGCSYGTYVQHYIFWIKDGEPVASGDIFPCRC